MNRLSVVLVQLALAALAGYGGARFALDRAVSSPAAPPALERTAPAAAPSPRAGLPPAIPGSGAAAALSVSYRSAVERASPSVLTVHSARTAARGPFGLGGRQLLAQGLGSGVVIDDEGYIVTNYHVVADANELAVALNDGELRPAKLIGADPDSDLALLRVEGARLQAIAVGELKDMAVGDVVLAVGNPLGVGQTVTQGIISAMGRKGIGINPIENFIQTDAAINPGNSGGALIDTAGRLIGINSAILSRGGGSEGIGFAIPVDLAQKVVSSLKKTGRVARGWLGVSTGANPRGPGAVIIAVQPGSPAHRAGLTPGDILVRLGETEITQPDDLAGAVLELDAGTRTAVEIVRNGRRGTLEVQLGTRPALRREQQRG